MHEDRSDSTNPGTSSTATVTSLGYRRLAWAVGAWSGLLWCAVGMALNRLPDIWTGFAIAAALAASGAACVLGLRSGQLAAVEESRRLRKQHETAALAATVALAALREQVADLGHALAAERERYASAAAHAIAKQSVALGQLAAEVEQISAKVAALPSGEDLAEAAAAVYRRGLVNGAQQLAAGGEGRPLRVAGTDN